MSVQALGWVLDHSPAQGTDRLVLLSIANHAGQSPDDGAWTAWPGVAMMQREARLERTRTVQDALRRLVADGHLIRVINGAPDERIPKDRRPNLYRILLTNGVTCGVTPCRWCGVTPDAERGDAATSDGVTFGDRTGCRETSPKPSSEPSGKPSVEPTTTALPGFESSQNGSPPAEEDPEFVEFYECAYPKKSGRKVARTAWDKAVGEGARPATIIAGAWQYRSEVSERSKGYIKAPAVWLNQGCWDDEPGANDRSDRPKVRPLPKHTGNQGDLVEA